VGAVGALVAVKAPPAFVLCSRVVRSPGAGKAWGVVAEAAHAGGLTAERGS